MSPTIRVRIEVPRGSLVKRRPDGSVDFVSPIPCPFNYGSVMDSRADDGDPLDAVVLGPRLPLFSTVEVQTWGEVQFVDAGLEDPKLICGDRPPTETQWKLIRAFFTVYARAKRVLNRTRGLQGETGVRGWTQQ